MMKRAAVWRHFLCSKAELRLDITLKCGQSFRWKLLPQPIQSSIPPVPSNSSIYIGVLYKKLLLLSQDDNNVFYLGVNNSDCEKTEEQLKDYFQMSTNLSKLYQEWSDNDAIFEKLSTTYQGVRILRQDPVENLFSFICSANNNISRISGMVEKMCSTYGDLVCKLDNEEYFSFPPLEALSVPGVEGKLRELGFGYRAKYIQQSAKSILDNGGVSWLAGLREQEYSDARRSLIKLQGIGPKVADCILLMSLDQPGAVPVDTHMFNIAKQYLPHLNKTKTVTDKVYAEIGDHFRTLYGGHAGWAHSVLFSADLKHIQKSLENQTNKNKPEEVPDLDTTPTKLQSKSRKNKLKVDHKSLLDDNNHNRDTETTPPPHKKKKTRKIQV